MSAELSLSSVMKRLVRVVMVLICGVAGYQVSKVVLEQTWWPALTLLHPLSVTIVIILMSACIGFILAPFFWFSLRKFGLFIEFKMQSMSVSDLIVSLMGLIVGLFLANLIAMPLSRLPGGVGVYIAILLNIALGYLGYRSFSRRRDEIWNALVNVEGIRSHFVKHKGKNGERNAGGSSSTEQDFVEFSSPKILDTSAIIDGRILDVAKTGFLEGTIVLPHFVLTELQGVADSTDSQRRTRGRRGLSVVSELQKISSLNVEISKATLKELERDKVDEALVVLTHRLNGKVVTTDYNLNQVAQIEGVSVLNVNDLANSLKPMLLRGDQVEVEVIRVGKEIHQGVGYLDDGTMFVVEDGYRHVGEKVTVTVTSMLQTSAGRMVFGRICP